MPDGVDALLTLAAAPQERADAHRLQPGRVQPVGRGGPRRSAARVSRTRTSRWETDVKRQGIVDSWPADVDDTAARRDWGFAPAYDFERAFRDYLIPTIQRTAICEMKQVAWFLVRGPGWRCGTRRRSRSMTRRRAPAPDPYRARRRALREAGARRRAARRRLRRRVLRPGRVAEAGRGGEDAAGRRSIAQAAALEDASCAGARGASRRRERRRDVGAAPAVSRRGSSRRCGRASRCCRARS